MSTFVEIAPEEYDLAAFKSFDPAAAGFEIGNARAMMWLAQLAYETHRMPTIEIVSRAWDFKSVASFIKHKTSLKGSFETCGLIGERAGAVILAFAGTDPGIWQNLATDFTPLPQAGSDIHEGFRLAAAAAQSEVEQAVRLSQQSQKPLFITGHSLGAALAALAAQMALEEGSPPSAVYAFGMPRVGGEKFESSYDASLGARTYRLVHGIDLVARVPPSFAGFRHVGRVLQCDAGAKFDRAMPLSPIGSDDPSFGEQLPNMFRRGVSNVLAGRILSPTGPGTFGTIFRFIPPEIRDHLQDSYWTALAP
ncbi:lipase family protein [Bradyrhizobium sp. CW1]|uniref:lipase family protein n=1 Tax=Bradyrhizobium sp. CW1 TaxID=2782686 RepID=UPI001FFEF2BD|nr:lipase family protein [Bradyrhizobium sp. CW1]UPJ27808.1 lipase family protein [Bradyrhizobium sp. CW1]